MTGEPTPVCPRALARAGGAPEPGAAPGTGLLRGDVSRDGARHGLHARRTTVRVDGELFPDRRRRARHVLAPAAVRRDVSPVRGWPAGPVAASPRRARRGEAAGPGPGGGCVAAVVCVGGVVVRVCAGLGC